MVRNSSLNEEFLENKTGEIAGVAYLLSIAEIVNSIQQVRTSALFIVNTHIFVLIWGNDYTSILIRIVKIKMTIYHIVVQQFFQNLIHCTHWKIILDAFITIFA